MAEARRGFFPFVSGDQVSVREAGGIALLAKNSMQLTQGGGQWIGSGNSLSVNQGGAWVMGAAGGISVDQGGAAVMAARDIAVRRSYMGVAIGGRVSIDDSSVMLGSGGSFAAGALLGLLIGWLIRRKSP